MSTLIGIKSAAGGTPGMFLEIGNCQNDDCIQPPDYRFSKPQTREGIAEYSDILWPRSSLTGSGGQDGITIGGGGILQSINQYWEWNTALTGNHTRKVISGVVLNASSVPVVGATVQLFNTATGALVDTQTSGQGGIYSCGDPNAVNCFAVAYLSGSPDTAGTTVDTLTGV